MPNRPMHAQLSHSLCPLDLISPLPGKHSVTFSKLERQLGEVVFDTPLDRLMIGSDSPFSIPSELGGGRREYCHPGHMLPVAEKVAQIKGATVTEVLEASRECCRLVYGV